MGSEDLVCEEGGDSGVPGPRAKEDDAPGFWGFGQGSVVAHLGDPFQAV